MNYSGNMPDWHQYNPPQPGINDVTSTAQNSGHLSFISSISPTCPTQLNSLNLSSEGLEKHQNDSNFNPRHYQPHLANNISHGHNAADNASLASMVQMQNCIGHYGPTNTRNSMVDNMNGPIDPRSAAMGGLNEELGYRNNQVPLNGPISHMNGPNVMNMNATHGSIGPRSTNVNSHTANRTGPPPSFVPCKGLCCNSDPNMGYQQWEKYCSYQNNANYRDNIRTSAGYQADARRFGSDFNFRKDNFDGKEVLPSMVPPSNGSSADHRRNFADFKYRKDRMLPRNYSTSNMLQNYPMQNYNYTTEYQKYPYNVKEYPKVSGMNVPSQGIVKHQEQSFAMTQQKYSHKQVPYQNSSAMMPSGMPSTSVPNPIIPSTQNTYFNPQYPRNLTTDDCQETADNASMVNRMQTSTMHTTSHPRYQMYQQKIAMQRFSMENHLRELSRIPGYQSHPKYKEYLHRHREILKLQQSVTYQGQIQQTPPCVTAASTVNTSAIPPINLQFDQNGVLINSNYMPETFPRVQQAVNPQASVDVAPDKQGKPDGNSVPEMVNHNVQKPEQLVSQRHDDHVTVLCPERVPKQQDRYPTQKSLDPNQFQAQKTASEAYNNLGTNATDTAIQQKMSKEFADKPELDVRQFLANWDESEDEDGASTGGLPNTVLSDSTPVVVVGYENVDLSAKTLEGLDGSKSAGITSGVITFENQDKGNIGVVPGQDCLTISYSSAENVEIAKNPSCKEIAKESIVRSGGHIIQCISNGPDEVPTIHIVDNLEIGSILQVTNGQVTETLERTQDAVPFFQERTEIKASAIALETEKFKKANGSDESAATEYTADLKSLDKEKYIEGSPPSKTVENASRTPRTNDQEMTILPTSIKNNLDSAQDTNLKKQSSFASEESHNPDDISLPDLPTSECTPISTTLNTPIHSDNEESSERVEDLTISTNPIEIIQNSPMISFTQSPTKGEPYDHLSDEGTVGNKSSDSLEGEYRTRNRFKNDEDNGMLDHDTVLGTFEFSTDMSDKSECTITTKSGKERGGSVSANNNEKAFSMDDETGNVEAASMCMTVTSGEYELKIVSTEMQNKSTHDYKNSMGERRANESQVTVARPDAHKKLQVLPETSAKTAPRYNGPTELGNALQNIVNNPDPVEFAGGQDDINYSKGRCISNENEKNELTHKTVTMNTINLSSTNDAAPGNTRPVVEDSCTTKIVKNNPPTSHSTKHSILSSDKLRRCETLTGDKFAKENSSSKKIVEGDRSSKIDAKDLKSSRHVKLADRKKSASSSQTISHKKRYSSESTEKRGEITIHHNKYTQEAVTRKEKSGDLKESNISHNKPIIIDNVSINDNVERMRLLKEYRRMKYKSPNIGEIQNKSKDTKEVSDYATSKKCHLSSNPDERSVSQSPSDKQLCQKDVVSVNSTEEQERKRPSILKTFVTKNINPDFAIQVTNVNLKLKDNEHQKELQRLGEEAKNSGPLDAIKIEINVSCTERNTTEKLLHENIKNAVAETIGHLTNSISNGARSNSTSITEIQCDKKVVGDQMDHRDYEGRNRSPSTLMEACTYNDTRTDENDTEIAKHKSAIIACKENAKDETPNLLIPKKRRGSLSERESINDMYEDNGHVNINAKPEPEATSAVEASKSEHTTIRRRSVHQDTERKAAAGISAARNLCSEEPKIISNNSPYAGTTSKSIVQKKEHQETTATSVCTNTRSLPDDVASRLNAIPSTSSTAGISLEDTDYGNPVNFNYDHFDVAPNEDADADDNRIDKWKKPKRDDGRFGNFDLYETVSGYVNPTFFSANELENLNTVPVYTTKDGKITYSPNPRFTYRELIIEARESYGDARESYFARSPSYDHYNCSKLRKLFKRNRDVSGAATKHIDYLSSKSAAHKNVHCAKARNTSHLEFFNNDADKLYVNRSSQQEVKDSNKKSIVDLSFLEKQYNVDGESASNIKHCKTKIFANNLEYEKGYGETSVFDSNLFLGPRAACWEETMESLKSYSSHIDRRNNDNFKELNFSEIFSAQKQLDPFPFLSAEQNSSGNGNHKADYNVANVLHHATCNYTDDLSSIPDGSRREQSNTVSHNEEENIYNSQNDASETDNKSPTMLNALLNMQENDEYTKKQEPQSDGTKSNIILFTEAAESCSKVTDEEVHESEKDRCSVDCIKEKETLMEHPAEDDTQARCVSPKADTFDAENANAKQVSDKNSVEIASPSKSDFKSDSKLDSKVNTEADSKNLLDHVKYAETVKEFALPLNEQNDEINDTVKVNTIFVASQEIVYRQVSSIPIDARDKEEVTPAVESDILTEIDFDRTNKRDDVCDGKNPTACKENEPIALQEPSDVTTVEQSEVDEGGSEQRKSENDGQKSEEISSKDRENDEVDNCDPTVSTPIAPINLHTTRTENDVCDLFTSEKREQNISEFTVIKSIIKGDTKQCQEPETKENNPTDCDSIIDSKLLCLDSSDCGIYAEDRCTLTQMSEHDFTEEDSMVPMEWETSQIQEDAVNRLCSIDESSIDFTGAANSLQDNSLLDNLSNAPAIKESQISEMIIENESKYDESASAVESTPTGEKSKAIPSNDEDKEQNQVSSSSYEKVAYLRSTDCNANTKMVPKLVIKKSEASSKFITKMSPSSVTQMDNNMSKSFLKLGCQPKVPKMIIRNARSRPGTPSIEAVREQVPTQVNISDRTSLTNEELCDSENSLQELSSYRNKIPKMKIKLDEKHSNKIMRTEDTTDVCVKRKNMKKTVSKESKDPERERYEKKIPVLKLKKQERNRSSSPEVSRKRQSSSHSEVPLKKYKKSRRDEIGHFTRHSNSSDSMRTVTSECETKKSPLMCTSEKIPKVIIKRTSASAEFKCELSKSCKNVIAKSAKWQPEVKLERYRVLDSMVKDLKLTLSPISLRTINKIFANHKSNYHREREDDYKLSRSNSTSDLLPIKRKQRRMSDYDCRKTNDMFRIGLSFASSKDTDSKNNKAYATPKKNTFSRNCGKSSDKCQKDSKHRSRSRDNNSRVEADITSVKQINQSFGRFNSETITSRCDEYVTDGLNIYHEEATKAEEDATIASKFDQVNIPDKHSSNSINLKLALKDSKTSKIDTCFVKLSGLNEIFTEEIDLQTDKERKKERDDDPMLNKDDNKLVIKKERLSSSSDMDNYCALQDDIGLIKDDSTSMLDNFEMNKNSIIKVESSDDSQSTIEILPASLDDNHSELESNIIEDGDSEQLYSADAIPTQFELELDIADNSDADLLDVSMPKLDPITCYSSCRLSAEEFCGDQALKVERHNKSETSTCSKNLFGTDKRMEIDINGDNSCFILENNSVGHIKEISSKSPCDKAMGSTTTKESFCCNDSLIKEVLAAKETLKKCLSKSKYEIQSNATTAAEKEQGSGFDLNDLSETHSSDAPQESRNEVTSQDDSTLVTSKLDKIVSNTEKSDKKHSKQSKSPFAKKKSPEKNDKVNSKEAIKDTHEYSTISLKAFKRFGKTASHESLTRTVCLSEKRKKNPTDQNNGISQLQDLQWKGENKMSSYKIPKISKSAKGRNANGNVKKVKTKEDNMPILEPENTADFDASSDRNSSRSPPVITIQASGDLELAESKLVDDKMIMSNDKIEDEDTKNDHKKGEMSVADFITQLAYHEKATIKHRRYCNLCEKWFPTTSRHRRHLAGYQHRHIELTQRRSIHALFMLFTGQPCPKLLPANVARNDCSVGELTPLQIAVQDVTKCFDCTEQSPKKQNDVDK